MRTVQGDVISGNVWNTYTAASQEYGLGTMPYLGQKVCYRDGREYVFVSSDVAVGANLVVSAPLAIAELDGTGLVAAAGTYVVTLVKSGVTANLYEGGTLCVTETSGASYAYPIKSNTAAATVATVANTVLFTLGVPLIAAVAVADAFIIVPNRWNSVILGQVASDPLGIAVVATTGNTAKAYFWVQTKGVGLCKVGTEAGADLGVAVVCAANGETDAAATTNILYPIGIYIPQADVASGDSCPIDIRL